MSEVTTAPPSPVKYETTTFTLTPDSLGPNKAILLHARTTNNKSPFYKSILYIHGYSDYFFHDHLCLKFLEHGYDLFALDLRKCGRSIISPAQDKYTHYCKDLHEYDEEITLAIDLMCKESQGKPKKLILFGHSTGGLVVSLYASSGPRARDIDAVILNGPYLAALNLSIMDSIAFGFLMTFGLSKDVEDKWYGRSINKAYRGEWDFDVKIHPVEKIRIHGPTFSAIHTAQNYLIKNKFPLNDLPVLFLSSNRSLKAENTWRDEYAQVDLILDVTTMREAASNLSHNMTFHEIENAMHDVFLSALPVREKAFDMMFQWLKHLEDDWMTSRQA